MKQLALLVGILLFVLASCSTGTLTGTPLTDQAPQEDLPTEVVEDAPDAACAAVTCGPGSICVDGSCECASDKKRCGDLCIDKNSCCSSDDCRAGETCEAGSCKFDCSNLVCATGMTCDPEAERCVCPSGYKWCERQDKCIPQDHCCSRFDCRNDERCTDTITTAEICIEDGGKSCKIFNTVGQKTLTIPGGSYTVNLTQITFLDSIDLMIDGTPYTLKEFDRKSVGDSSSEVFIQKFRELGGECRNFDTNN